jgi:hypothetical protein
MSQNGPCGVSRRKFLTTTVRDGGTRRGEGRHLTTARGARQNPGLEGPRPRPGFHFRWIINRPLAGRRSRSRATGTRSRPTIREGGTRADLWRARPRGWSCSSGRATAHDQGCIERARSGSARKLTPVRLPPGRARLATSPSPTGSAPPLYNRHSNVGSVGRFLLVDGRLAPGSRIHALNRPVCRSRWAVPTTDL